MAAAKKTTGFKRICASCGTRFYDFGKRPIVCPTCSTEFSGEYKVRGGRKGRIAAELKREEEEVKKPQVEAHEDEGLEEEEDVEVVSLEDVEEADDDDAEEETVKVADDDDLDDIPEFDEDLDEDLEEDEKEVLDEEED